MPVRIRTEGLLMTPRPTEEKGMTRNLLAPTPLRGVDVIGALTAAATVVVLSAAMAGCSENEARTPDPRPVRAVIIEPQADGEIASFTGQIRARDQFNLAFRLDGRVVERHANLGDVITAGQVVARLDSQNQQNALRSAEANLAAAHAALTEARLTFGRQQGLLKGDATPRARFDSALEALRAAEALFDASQAQVQAAQDQLSYTILRADRPGAVTAVGAEPGEVVRAGQTIVQLAGQSELDAVFDIPEHLIRTGPRDPVVDLALSGDAQVRATGFVRQVSPQADSATRTFQVKVGIHNPPDGMRLGSTVTGRLTLAAPEGVEIPASALTGGSGRPAVWVVDRASLTVSLRPVDVARFDPASVVISKGLEKGDLVVSAGVQVLRPGQKVRLLGEG
jgi:RND family efflux transporter MFP subunit